MPEFKDSQFFNDDGTLMSQCCDDFQGTALPAGVTGQIDDPPWQRCTRVGCGWPKAEHEVAANRKALVANRFDTALTVGELLRQLAGAASLCWEPKPCGVFDSNTALLLTQEAEMHLGMILAGTHEDVGKAVRLSQEYLDSLESRRPRG